MSDFVKQNSTVSNFNSSNSWVILSPIEQSIKSKIEKVGTPLKAWDINIYRGVLTGYNDAFIISGEKRQQILDNCNTKDERKRTADLIRPILRGRDIGRYGYNFADLYLINTHNGIKEKNIPPINIKDYPAVKEHLDKYWDKISVRADKGDTPYNLRNCAYMEDFNKPKVVYTPVNSEYKFTLVPEKYVFNNSLFMITGEGLEIICALCNSSLFQFYLKKILSSGNYQYGSGNFFENLPLIKIQDKEQQKKLKMKLLDIQKEYTKSKAIEIDSMIFDLYNLSQEERDKIGYIIIK